MMKTTRPCPSAMERRYPGRAAASTRPDDRALELDLRVGEVAGEQLVGDEPALGALVAAGAAGDGRDAVEGDAARAEVGDEQDAGVDGAVGGQQRPGGLRDLGRRRAVADDAAVAELCG